MVISKTHSVLSFLCRASSRSCLRAGPLTSEGTFKVGSTQPKRGHSVSGVLKSFWANETGVTGSSFSCSASLHCKEETKVGLIKGQGCAVKVFET